MNNATLIFFVLAMVFLAIVWATKRPIDRGAAVFAAMAMIAVGIATEVLAR